MFYITFKQYLFLIENEKKFHEAYQWLRLHPASFQWLLSFKENNNIKKAREYLQQKKRF